MEIKDYVIVCCPDRLSHFGLLITNSIYFEYRIKEVLWYVVDMMYGKFTIMV